MIIPIDFDAFIILVFSLGTISGLSFCALSLEIIQGKNTKYNCPPPPSAKNDQRALAIAQTSLVQGMPQITQMETPPAPNEENIMKPQFVTLDNGQRPKEPVSFFHTKKFLAIGAVFAVIAGILYLLIVA